MEPIPTIPTPTMTGSPMEKKTPMAPIPTILIRIMTGSMMGKKLETERIPTIPIPMRMVSMTPMTSALTIQDYLLILGVPIPILMKTALAQRTKSIMVPTRMIPTLMMMD